jgi:hypothetical protein
MKALQEKKTSLRSIMRWGLVVFALAALVFAACDSGGGSGNCGVSLPQGRRIIRMEVTKPPTDPSFEGLPINLKGMEVTVWYSDNDKQVLTEKCADYYTRPLAERTSENPDEWWGNVRTTAAGPTLARVPPDYMFAEKHEIDYILGIKTQDIGIAECHLRVPSVLTLLDVHFLGEDWLLKQEFFIDDVIDFNQMKMECRYNNGLGRFGNQIIFDQSELGTYMTVPVPFFNHWDWSLNYPLSAGQLPFIMVNIGNDTVDGRPGNNKRLVHHKEWSFQKLFLVDELKVTKAPDLKSLQGYKGDGKFYSDYVMQYSTEKDEWFHNYLQDTEVTVHYTGTDKTKKMVAKPSGDMELPLYDFFANTDSLLSTARQSFAAPKFNGRTNEIRNAWNMLIVSHEGSERYQETNKDRTRPRFIPLGPSIKVYILQPELEIESIGGDIVFPIEPVADRGNVNKLLDKLKITGTWLYMDRDGENEDEKTREIKSSDPRLSFVSPRSVTPVFIDNEPRTPGSGVYDPLWWGRAYESPVRLRYSELGDVRRADGEIDVTISAD